MVKEKKKVGALEDESASSMSDWVKKNLVERLSTMLMTEEGLRSDFLDLKLPKSVIAAALAQADRTKNDISKLVAKEVRMFLEGIEVSELIKRVLHGQGIEITARIKFVSDQEESRKKPARKSPRKKRGA